MWLLSQFYKSWSMYGFTSNQTRPLVMSTSLSSPVKATYGSPLESRTYTTTCCTVGHCYRSNCLCGVYASTDGTFKVPNEIPVDMISLGEEREIRENLQGENRDLRIWSCALNQPNERSTFKDEKSKKTSPHRGTTPHLHHAEIIECFSSSCNYTFKKLIFENVNKWYG